MIFADRTRRASLRAALRHHAHVAPARLVLGALPKNGTRTLLAWAAEQGRVLLTHDVATITAFAYERVRAGKPMPGVFEVARTVALRSAIDDILLLATCSVDGEWEGQVRYLPLR